MPFFSVIIASYNRASIVMRAINSVLSQTFANFEVIVVDDGSNDTTEKVVLSIQDKRIRYVNQENKGVCAARNNGVSKAVGEYLVFLDSDDYASDNWLEDFYQTSLIYQTDFIFCDMKRVDLNTQKESIVKAQDPYCQGIISESGLYMPGTFCVKPTFFKLVGGFDVNLKYAEFSEFSFSSAKKNPTKSFTKKLGLIYEASITGGSKNAQNKIDSNLYIIQKHPWFFKLYPHVLQLYYQNVGVAYFHLSNWAQARHFFFKAYWIQPWKLKIALRFLISFFPKFAKKVIR